MLGERNRKCNYNLINNNVNHITLDVFPTRVCIFDEKKVVDYFFAYFTLKYFF